MNQTPTQIYQSTMDSVNLVNEIVAQPTKTEFDLERLRCNAQHVRIMLAKSIWTTEDLAPWQACVTAALDFVDLDAVATEPTATPDAPTVQDIQAGIVRNTQARLDAFAQTRAYDGILSACTYATSSVPRFQREGQDAVNARDATWAALYTIMGQVQAGELPMPTGFSDVEPLLPVLEWTP